MLRVKYFNWYDTSYYKDYYVLSKYLTENKKKISKLVESKVGEIPKLYNLEWSYKDENGYIVW